VVNGEFNSGINGVTVTLIEGNSLNPVVNPNTGEVVTAVTANRSDGKPGYATLDYVPADRQFRVEYSYPDCFDKSVDVNDLLADHNNDILSFADYTRKFSLSKGSESIQYVDAGLIGNCCPDVNSGFSTTATKRGQVRWRNLRINGNGGEIYVGSDAGNGGTRNEKDFYGTNPQSDYYFSPDANDISVNYDPNTGDLSTTTIVDGATHNVSYNIGTHNINYLKWQVNGDPGKVLEFNNVELTVNGITCSLGDFQTEYGDWYINFDLSSGFTLTGQLVINGQATNAEGMKLDIELGEEGAILPIAAEDALPDADQGLQVHKDGELTLFPVPAVDHVNVVTEMTEDVEADYRIFSVSGQLMQQGVQALSKGYNQFQLQLNGLTNGNYLLQLRTDEQVLTKRFIVQGRD
jgi:hypothetical protein